MRARAARRRRGGQLGNEAVLRIERVGDGVSTYWPATTGTTPRTLHARSGAQAWVPFRHAGEHHLPGQPVVQLRAGQGLGVAVASAFSCDERALTTAAHALRRDGASTRRPTRPLERLGLVDLGLEGVPPRRGHRAARRVPIHLHAGLQQGLAQHQRHGVSLALQRQQAQHALLQHEPQAAALRLLDEEVQVRLAVLDEVARERSGLGGLDGEARGPPPARRARSLGVTCTCARTGWRLRRRWSRS